MTVAEALTGFTLNPARLSGKDGRLGSITPGKYADLVILSRDLFTIAQRYPGDQTGDNL
ncbi:MAG: amidohydrolase family protein [Chloroflexota bacterium]